MSAVATSSVVDAIALWRDGRRQEAERLCDSLAGERGDADALSLLAEIYGATNRAAQALECLTRLSRVRHADAAIQRRLAGALLAVGDHVAAAASYRLALELEPGNVRAHNNLGQALMRLGRRVEAISHYERAIELDPGYATAHNNLGIALYELQRDEAAVACYRRAAQLDPRMAEAHYNCGNALARLGSVHAALESYERALALRPTAVECLVNRGVAQQRLGQLRQAVDSYDRALSINGDHVVALSNKGCALTELQQPDQGLECCDRALQLEPDCAEAHNNRAVALRALGRQQEAIAACDRALAAKQDYAEALCNRGKSLAADGQLDAAVASLERALVQQPGMFDAHYALAGVLSRLKRLESALQHYERALAAKPESIEVLIDRAIVLQRLRRIEAALASYEQVLRADPDHVRALTNCGAVLLDLGRRHEALRCLDHAIELQSDLADAHVNRGAALLQLDRLEEAVATCERALQLNEHCAEALCSIGMAWMALRQPQQAARAFARLADIAPADGYALGSLLNANAMCCDWTELQTRCERVVRGILDGERVILPLAFLPVSGAADVQQQCARIFVNDQYPRATLDLSGGRRYGHSRIRVAYMSADLRPHAVSYLLAGVFERHDRERFEIIALSQRPPDHSAFGRRVSAAFDRFIDISAMSDGDTARLVRELEVDIAVDLAGFTAGNRTAVFARRPAPIQVGYLGFPGTLAADYIDYLIADRFVIPEGSEDYYSERIAYLPQCFQANDDRRFVPSYLPGRCEVGLPEGALALCCFCNSYKINPQLYDVWMRLLQALPGSVLWLIADNASVEANLRTEAMQRGVDTDRVLFAPRLAYPEHLTRLQCADLFLDTFPFNGGATASDALWAGVPVVTCSGQAFSSRMAGSLLHAIGLPDLVTQNLQEYEELTLRLCTNPIQLAHVRTRLARNRASWPLFDTDRFRKHLESAYLTMWQRHEQGEPPASFAVPALRHCGPLRESDRMGVTEPSSVAGKLTG
jgi:predicted O-linked N-acetylglucosamine transferase (SPINDLY family)